MLIWALLLLLPYLMLGVMVACSTGFLTLPTVALWPLVVALDFCQPIPTWCKR